MREKEPNGNPHWIFLIVLISLIALSVIPTYNFGEYETKEFSLFSDIVKEEVEEDELIEEGVVANNPPNDTLTVEHKNKIIAENNKIGDTVIFEDYTDNKNGFSNFKKAIENRTSNNRPARIAVIGDSYIEGDIFTQDIRAILQKEYGGSGVGYINMYSEFPGFRFSVKQNGSGWNSITVSQPKEINNKYTTISERYDVSTKNSLSTYVGADKKHGQKEWDSSKFVCVAPTDAVVQVKTNGEWESHSLEASEEAQCIKVDGVTSSFSVRTSTPGVIGLGVWLDSNSGVAVDCMSARGCSGMNLAQVNFPLAQSISKHIEYDLLIIEFGLNVMTPKKKEYNKYTSVMTKIVAHLRRCYPHADIIIMGVGDRGEKRGATVQSMKVTDNMIKAQRDIAQDSKCLFWDTREAMGGEGSAVKWANNKPAYMNKDYTHLSHAGGGELAKEFVKTIKHHLNNK